LSTTANPLTLAALAAALITPPQALAIDDCADPDGSAFSVDLPTLFRPSFDIPLSAFTTNSSNCRPVNWADVNSPALRLSAERPVAATGDAFWALSPTAVPVPEPASAVLVAAGLALLLSRRKHIFAKTQHA
jgi:hypothetical protein